MGFAESRRAAFRAAGALAKQELHLKEASLGLEASGLLFKLVRSTYCGPAARRMHEHLHDGRKEYDPGRMGVVVIKTIAFIRLVKSSCRAVYFIGEGVNPMKGATRTARIAASKAAAESGKYLLAPSDCLVQAVFEGLAAANIPGVHVVSPPLYDSQVRRPPLCDLLPPSPLFPCACWQLQLTPPRLVA